MNGNSAIKSDSTGISCARVHVMRAITIYESLCGRERYPLSPFKVVRCYYIRENTYTRRCTLARIIRRISSVRGREIKWRTNYTRSLFKGRKYRKRWIFDNRLNNEPQITNHSLIINIYKIQASTKQSSIQNIQLISYRLNDELLDKLCY